MDADEVRSTAALGSVVRREREGRGWTLAELSARTAIPEPNLSRLERGLVDVRLSTLQRVADALGAEITLRPVGRERRLDEVVREAQEARDRIIAAGLGESDPWARLARRRARGEDTRVEAEALRRRDGSTA